MNQPPRQYAVWARPNPFFPRMIVAVFTDQLSALTVAADLEQVFNVAAEVIPVPEAPVC